MANDFSGDSNCVALWRFEDGALTVDSIGTNTLTAVGVPTADTSIYKEGGASVNYNSTYHGIFDADLDTGFPLKNGDTNKKISVCFWVRFTNLPGTGLQTYLFSKWKVANQRSILIQCYNDGASSRFYLSIGSDAGDEFVDHGSALSAEVWYHIGVTYQDSDKSYKIRIWDDNAGALLGGAEVSGNTTNDIRVSTDPVRIAYPSPYDWQGKIDEMVVFNRILTSDEIDQIRAGTYGAGLSLSGSVSCHSTVSANIDSKKSLAVSVEAAATAIASLSAKKTLSGSIDCQSSASGNLTIPGEFIMEIYPIVNPAVAGTQGLTKIVFT